MDERKMGGVIRLFQRQNRIDWLFLVLCLIALWIYLQVPAGSFWTPFVYRNF